MERDDGLSQDEIDGLLAGTPTGGMTRSMESIRSPADLGEHLFDALRSGRTGSGLFSGANLIMDRRLMKEAYLRASVSEPEAIVRVGDIEIFPVNVCPHCGYRMSDADVTVWFRDSVPPADFASRHPGVSRYGLERIWKAEIETLPCPSCHKPYQPSTVVTGRGEGFSLPSYCRCQTINHLQAWYDALPGRRARLFSVMSGTVLVTRSETLLYWDTFLNTAPGALEACPGDIMANILRYTPYRDIVRFSARESKLAVFGGQDFTALYRQEMTFAR